MSKAKIVTIVVHYSTDPVNTYVGVFDGELSPEVKENVMEGFVVNGDCDELQFIEVPLTRVNDKGEIALKLLQPLR